MNFREEGVSGSLYRSNSRPQCYHIDFIPHCSCTFEGTHDELKAHLDKCKFEGLKGFLSRTDDHLEELQEELKRKDEEIMFLRSMLASLSEKVDHMEKTAVSKIGKL